LTTVESPFAIDIVASPDEIDELNHVSNLVYLRWVLRVAQAHSTAVGYDWDAYRELGAVFVVRRHEIDYLRPAFAGDQISLRTWVDTWKGVSCVRKTSIVRSDGVEVARASTLWAFVSNETGRPQRIPAELKSDFGASATS
jgi:acyl-CoA thioester hydrolase